MILPDWKRYNWHQVDVLAFMFDNQTLISELKSYDKFELEFRSKLIKNKSGSRILFIDQIEKQNFKIIKMFSGSIRRKMFNFYFE